MPDSSQLTPSLDAPTPSRGGSLWRWLPPTLVVAGAIGAAIFLKAGSDIVDEQAANIQSMAAGLIGALLLMVWGVAAPGLSGRFRLSWLGGSLASASVFFLLFELVGFWGSLLPIFELRGSRTRPVAETITDSGDLTITPEQPLLTLRPAPDGAEDFLQSFGSNRDGHLPDPKLATDWSASPPTELWRNPVGEGWSGFAVSGPYAVTQEQLTDGQATVAYDLETGKGLWRHMGGESFENLVAGHGPRATPTIVGRRVYSLDSVGHLSCLDLADGREYWSINVLEDASAKVPEWGLSCSPLVHEGQVLVNAGGEDNSLVAYDATTGDKLWGSGSDGAQYSSVVATTLLGQPQFLVFGTTGLAAHRPGGGVLWTYDWPGEHPRVAMPIAVGDDAVFLSSGYGTGCHLVGLSRDESGAFSASRRWRSLSLKAKFAHATLRSDGHVYGLDDGRLACVELTKGRRRWKGPRDGHGQILWVGDRMIRTTESGEVVILEPTPEGPGELSRSRVFEAKTWNPPALAGQYLLVRNNREAVCLRLPLAR